MGARLAAVAITFLLIAPVDAGATCVDYSQSTRITAQIDTPGTARDIGVDGTVACVADDDRVSVLDVSDPDAPTLVGEVLLAGPRHVAVAGDFAYVTGIGTDFRVVDVSTPSAPTLRGVLVTTSSNTGRIRVHGSRAYIADGNIARIIDISDPDAPSTIGTIPHGSVAAVESDGSFAYVSAYDSAGVGVFDISVPSAPVRVGTAPVSGDFGGDLVLDGSVLYAVSEYGIWNPWSSGGAGYVDVFDVSDPTAPVPLSTLVWGSLAIPSFDRIDLCGSLAIVATSLGVLTLDVTDPSNPVELSRVTGAVSAGIAWDAGVSCTSTHAFVAGSLVAALEVSPVPTPADGVVQFTGDAVTDMVAVGNTFFASLRDSLGEGLLVLDAAGPSVAQQGFAFNGGPGAETVAANGSVAFTSNYDGYYEYGTLTMYDVSSPSSPQVVSTLPGWYDPLEVEGSFLYAGTQIFQILESTLGARGTLSSAPQAIDVVGSLAYLAMASVGFQGLEIHDVSNPDAPALAGSLALGGLGGSRAITVQGSLAYVGAGSDLAIVDVSVPTAPTLVSMTPVYLTPTRIVVKDGVAYVRSAGGGFRVVDVADPAAPVVLGTAGTTSGGGQGAMCLADDSLVFVEMWGYASGGSGVTTFHTYPLQCATTPVVGVPIASTAGWELRLAPPFPNPSRGAAAVSFELPADGNVDLAVFDVAGRRIRTLAKGTLAEGAHMRTWSGTNAAGRIVPAGVYFVRLAAAGRTETMRIVRAR